MIVYTIHSVNFVLHHVSKLFGTMHNYYGNNIMHFQLLNARARTEKVIIAEKRGVLHNRDRAAKEHAIKNYFEQKFVVIYYVHLRLLC